MGGISYMIHGRPWKHLNLFAGHKGTQNQHILTLNNYSLFLFSAKYADDTILIAPISTNEDILNDKNEIRYIGDW